MDWLEFVEYWMDHCSSNGMSVVAIDETQHRVAGAFIVRDLLMKPEGFEEKYSSDDKTLTPIMQFCWFLDAEATKKLPALADGKAVDLFMLGVHPDYRGNRIASFLTKGVTMLTRKAGWKYATIEATSYFTSCAAKTNKFTPLYEIDAKDWLWKESRFIRIAKNLMENGHSG